MLFLQIPLLKITFVGIALIINSLIANLSATCLPELEARSGEIQMDPTDSTMSLPTAAKLLHKALVSKGNSDRLESVFAKASKGEKLVIGVLGGSITAGSASTNPDRRYANVILAWWKKTFPTAEFELINAGIGATSSDYGAMRLKNDLLYRSPDMVIVEYACNDSDTKEYAESFEGVVRQILKTPQKPALMLLFMAKKNGTNAQQWESKIGKHYKLPMISYRDAIWSEIKAGRLHWDQISPDQVHPNDIGHKLAGELVCGLLEKTFKKFSADKIPPVGDVIPPPLISEDFEFTSLFDGETLIPLTNRNWVFDGTQKRSAGWKSSLPGSVLEFEISGQMIFLSCWTINGPMGKASVSVDGGTTIIIDAWFDQTWGGYRHMLQIGNNLSQGNHIIRIELLEERNPKSNGNEFRILCLGSAGTMLRP